MSFNSFLQVRWGLPAILMGQRTAPGATLKVAPVPKTPRRRTSEPESERGLSQAAAATHAKARWNLPWRTVAADPLQSGTLRGPRERARLVPSRSGCTRRPVGEVTRALR